VDSDAMSTADTGFASFKAEHATLESLAAKKAKKSKGPFNRDNAWKRYDHKLDPQSFPEGQSERGGMDTTTQATGESIVGNEGVDSDAMSTADTGFASFKAEHATLESLAAKKAAKTTEAITTGAVMKRNTDWFRFGEPRETAAQVPRTPLTADRNQPIRSTGWITAAQPQATLQTLAALAPGSAPAPAPGSAPAPPLDWGVGNGKACLVKKLATLRPTTAACKMKLSDFEKNTKSNFTECIKSAEMRMLKSDHDACDRAKTIACRCMSGNPGYQVVLKSPDCLADGYRNHVSALLGCNAFEPFPGMAQVKVSELSSSVKSKHATPAAETKETTTTGTVLKPNAEATGGWTGMLTAVHPIKAQLAVKPKKAAAKKGAKKKPKESEPPTSGLFPQSDRYWNRKEFWGNMKAKPQTAQLAAKPKAKKAAAKKGGKGKTKKGKASKPPTSEIEPQSYQYWNRNEFWGNMKAKPQATKMTLAMAKGTDISK